MAESVIPALERVLLLLEELRSWTLESVFLTGGLWPTESSGESRAEVKCSNASSPTLHLDPLAVEKAMNLALGLTKLSEKMRQEAEFESEASTEWFKWIKYGQLKDRKSVV